MFFIPRALLQHIKKIKKGEKDNEKTPDVQSNSYDSESSEEEDDDYNEDDDNPDGIQRRKKTSGEGDNEGDNEGDGMPEDQYYNPKYYPDASIYLRMYLHLASSCNVLVSQDWFNYLILIVIIVAGLLVGVETYASVATNPIVVALDEVVLVVFIFEMLAKMCAEGLLPYRYFTNTEWRWNWFDSTIIVLSLPMWGTLFGGGSIKMLRLIRLTRLGKIVRRIPPLQMIIRGILGGLKSCGYITLLQILVFYIFSVIGFYFFSVNDPFHYGTVPFAMFTLFRLYTLDNWGDFMFVNTYGCNQYQDMYVSDNERTPFNYMLWCQTPQQYWYAPFFCLIFILVAQMIILSLFIGAVSNSMMDSMDQLQTQRQNQIKQAMIEKNKARILAFARPGTADGVSPDETALAKRRPGYNELEENSSPLDSQGSPEGKKLETVERTPLESALAVAKVIMYWVQYPFYLVYEMGRRAAATFHMIETAHYQSELSKLFYVAMKYDAHEELRVLQKRKRAATTMLARSSKVTPDAGAGTGTGIEMTAAGAAAATTTTSTASPTASGPNSPAPVNAGEGAVVAGGASSKSPLSSTLSVGGSMISTGEPSAVKRNKYAHKDITIYTIMQDMPTSFSEVWVIWAKICRVISEHKHFNNFVTLIILCAAIDIGLQTDFRIKENKMIMDIVAYVDVVILTVFAGELIFKLCAEEFRPWAYFYSGWNVFDFVIVVSSFVSGAGPMLLLLRLLRLLRVLKLVKKLPRLSIIINAFLIAGQSIGWALVLLLLFHYVFGIIGLMLFKTNDPHRFGSLHKSMLAVFRLISLDDSSYMAYINAWGCDLYPDIPYQINPGWCSNPQAVGIISFVYYIILVTIGNQILLSLFIGVLSTSLDQARTNFLKEKEFDEKISEFCDTLYAMTPKRVKAFKAAFKLLDIDGSDLLDDEKIRLGINVLDGLETLLSEEYAASIPPGVKFKPRQQIRMSEEELNFLQRKCEGSTGNAAVRAVTGLHIIAFIKFMCSTPMFLNNEKVGREVELRRKRIASRRQGLFSGMSIRRGGGGADGNNNNQDDGGELSEAESASIIQRYYRQYRAAKARRTASPGAGGGDGTGNQEGSLSASLSSAGGGAGSVAFSAGGGGYNKSAMMSCSNTPNSPLSRGLDPDVLGKFAPKVIGIPDFIFAHNNNDYVY